MMKKFVARAGEKIKRLARAGFLGRKRNQERVVENEETLPPNVSADKEEIEKPSEPIAQADVTAGKSVQEDKPKESDGDNREGMKSRRKPRWSLDNFQVSPREGVSRFHDFELPLSVMRGVAEQEFEYCTPIQEKALPTVLAGKDLVGKANTGTGKSAVFLIAIFSRLLQEGQKDSSKGKPRALVIAPTRELVIQITKDGRKLGKYTGLSIHAVYGGANYEKQMEVLQQRTVDIVVATPGRLLDFANKRIFSFADCNIMVIDEADRMLDMGFIPDVRRIISRLPSKEERQTLLFSATVSDDVKRLAYQWCVKPQYLEAEEEQVSVESIDQRVYLTTTEEKYTVLYNLIKSRPADRIMVFANMKSEVRKLSERLQRDGVDCVLLSGDVQQVKREKRLERFRAGKTKVLVATDVAGRGIHIEGINYVVNFTLPYEPEDYVHRIGRTGRAGAEGVSISFACEEGAFVLPDIEEYIGRSIECSVVPEELLAPVPEPVSQPKAKPGGKRRRRRGGSRSRGRNKSRSKDKSEQSASAGNAKS